MKQTLNAAGLELVYLPSSEIKPYPGNPRAHPEQQIDMIAASIEAFSFNNPVLITPDRVLIVGHGRLLKVHDLITSPAFIVIKAASEFKDKTTAPNQMWQTDFTYLKIIGWGWYYLSTILDDFSRYIIAWKLCTTMKAEDVTDTLDWP